MATYCGYSPPARPALSSTRRCLASGRIRPSRCGGHSGLWNRRAEPCGIGTNREHGQRSTHQGESGDRWNYHRPPTAPLAVSEESGEDSESDDDHAGDRKTGGQDGIKTPA